MILDGQNGTDADAPAMRAPSEYATHSEKYILKDVGYDRQYASYYCARLSALRNRLATAAVKRWGKSVPIKKVCDISPEEDCIVIGTVFKKMELQPSILKELAEQLSETPLPPRESFFTDGDQLFIEDELQRISLCGSCISHKDIVTGVVIAVRGAEKETESGIFVISDYCTAGLPEQPPTPTLNEDRYVLLLSGLNIGNKVDSSLERQLLSDYLSGLLAQEDSDLQTISKVCHIIVAGNCLAADTQENSHLQKAKYLTKKSTASSVEPAKVLDSFVRDLVVSAPVTLMPGEFDPCNFHLPQQPLHPCLFPLSGAVGGTSGLLNLGTNPHDFSVCGFRFLGTSGQNVTNVMQYSALDDPLVIIEKMLMWNHVAPTAPDTLGAYPFVTADPFVIENCPHIFFAGNQKGFACRTVGPSDRSDQKVLLLALPSFSETGTCVLLNLRTLECQPLTFSLHGN